ncbi:MAG: chlorophyll a/b-binding protein [Prochlorococcus sp.]
MLPQGVSLGGFFLIVSLPMPPMTFARLSQVEFVHGRFAMASLLALVLAALMIKL